MELKHLALPLLVGSTFTSTLAAQEYQFYHSLLFSEQSSRYSNEALSLDGSDDISFQYYNGSYYFNPNPTLGPLAESLYLNRINKLDWSLSGDGAIESKWVNGEYYTGDWAVSASIGNSNGGSVYNLEASYFVNDNLKLSARNLAQGSENIFDADFSTFFYGLKYVMPLMDNNYIGVTYEVDEEFDNHSFSTKYFTALSNERYFAINASYDYEAAQTFTTVNGELSRIDSSSSWNVSPTYYFNRMTSVSVGIGKFINTDARHFSVQHFINNNFSVNLSYSNVDYELITDTNRLVGESDTTTLNFSHFF